MADYRSLFDLPASPIYISGASRSPMPRKVLHTGIRAMRRKVSSPWSIAASEHRHVDERLRKAWAQLLNATPDHFSFAPSCSYAISVVANILVRSGTIKREDSILVLNDQMSSSVYPWQQVVHDTGARLKVVRLSDGEGGSNNDDWTQAVLNATSATVKVVCVPNVHWCDGSLLDLKKIGEKCRACGAVLVVDATQSLGALPLDVGQVRPDFVAASSHKWLMGPYGVCLLYSDARWHGIQMTNKQDGQTAGVSNLWPLEHHEHNRFNPTDIDCLPLLSDHNTGFIGYEPRFKQGARAYDSGGRPNPILMPMVCTAVEMVLRWGPDQVHNMLRVHTDQIAAMATRLGLRIPSRRAAHICGVDRCGDETWADRCSTFLASKGIIVASRFGKLRVAPHVYNTSNEIQQLCTLLMAFEVMEGRRKGVGCSTGTGRSHL